MSTETGPDRPPQRTVAELLAAHGGGQPTSGRRRARRDPADDGDVPPDPRNAEGRIAPPQSEGGPPAWGAPGNAPAGNTGGQGNAGWPGARRAGGDRQPESLNRRGPAQLPESPPDWRGPGPLGAPDRLSAGPAVAPASQPDAGWRPSGPDPRWAAAQPAAGTIGADPRLRGGPPAGQPHRPSRREIREAREAGLSQLEATPSLQGQGQGQVDGVVQGRVNSQVQAPHARYTPPAQRSERAPGQLFVENPTDEMPRVAEPTGSSGSHGHRAASAPTDDRPAAPPRRARIAQDAGPATGAMSPEDLLADDDDDDASDEVRILGRSLADLEITPAADGDAGDPDSDNDDAPEPVSRLSRRITKPKRGFRLRGKSKADAEETVLTAARPPSAPTFTPPDMDVEQDEDDLIPDAAPRARSAHRAPIGGFSPAVEDVPAGLADKSEVAPETAAEPRPDRAAAVQESPAKAWLLIIAQLVGGAVAGAALWVAFRYLWGKLPPVALGAAVLATAGSVLLVRAIRRSDDLRTSLFAVLVGLVVTVSPAVLVLVSR